MENLIASALTLNSSELLRKRACVTTERAQEVSFPGICHIFTITTMESEFAASFPKQASSKLLFDVANSNEHQYSGSLQGKKRQKNDLTSVALATS